jgi:hypothetical protein
MRTQEQIEHTKQLVEVLRSGKYKQAFGRLKVGKSYCCLGVACLVAGRTFAKDGFCDGVACRLPSDVAKYFGFLDCSGAYNKSSLTSMNDSGKPFTEIADIIEKMPKGLFV